MGPLLVIFGIIFIIIAFQQRKEAIKYRETILKEIEIQKILEEKIDKKKDIVQEKLDEISEKEKDILEKEVALEIKDQIVEEKIKNMSTRELALDTKEKSVINREVALDKLSNESKRLINVVSQLTEQKENLLSEINEYYDKSLIATYPSTIISEIENSSSSEIKNKLSLLKIEEKKEIIQDAVIIRSFKKLSKENSLKKKILLSFDSEVTGLLNILTLSNIDSIRNRIVKVFDKLNRLYKEDGIELNKKILKMKLQQLELHYSYIVKVNDEREQQKAIKEQMIEEDKVRRELEREKKRIDKEEQQFNSEISKLMSYMQKSSADVEKELYADKIKELELKLKELEDTKKDVLNRELNTRAGYVYVISNIGSFGENIYKIGMTRRLEPMDRVKELGSASVPFEFDVHAMIFSEDAPKLENQLHSHFRKNEVNKINKRKEFFNVSLEEIEKVVLENYNGTVTFTKIAKAEQYRLSLAQAQQTDELASIV